MNKNNLKILLMQFITFMAKLNFQHHYFSLPCHKILQKSFLCADFCSRNISHSNV